MPYKDKEQQREYQRLWMKNRRLEWINENGPCAVCGGTAELEIDHDDASFKDTHRIWSWSKKRRDAELLKCRVLCFTCHKLKTEEKLEAGYKLTKEQVEEIRRLRWTTRLSLQELADMFGVCKSNIDKIVREKSRRGFMDPADLKRRGPLKPRTQRANISAISSTTVDVSTASVSSDSTA